MVHFCVPALRRVEGPDVGIASDPHPKNSSDGFIFWDHWMPQSCQVSLLPNYFVSSRLGPKCATNSRDSISIVSDSKKNLAHFSNFPKMRRPCGPGPMHAGQPQEVLGPMRMRFILPTKTDAP